MNNIALRDNKTNFESLAKASGLNMESNNKNNNSMLARLKISHTPIMGQTEIKGKITKVEVVSGGMYKLEDVENSKTYYSSNVSVRPFLQRFMYKKWVKPEGEHGHYIKTVMSDNLNNDLKDSSGGFNCGKPAGYIKDYNALPETTKNIIKGIKRVRAILGTATFKDIVDDQGNSVEDSAVNNKPMIWEIDNRDAFKTLSEPFSKCSNLKHLPLQHTIDVTTDEMPLPNGNSFYLPKVKFNVKEVPITDKDESLWVDLLAWVDNYNTYIFDQWTKNADNLQQDKLSKENEDLVDSFVDVEMQEDAKK
tara:strand:- start:896 stop:1816 length:921 start_codon:yes stop_codon:yes gene_type:complete